MRTLRFRTSIIAALSLCILFSGPRRANAQSPVVAEEAAVAIAESPAARAFASLVAGYVFGKAADGVYHQFTKPDPKTLDEDLLRLQKDHPEYRDLLSALRLSVTADTDRAAFEAQCLKVMDKLNRAQVTKPIVPPFDWMKDRPLPVGQYRDLGATLKALDVATSGLRPISPDLLGVGNMRLNGLSVENKYLLGHALVPMAPTTTLAITNPTTSLIVGAWSFLDGNTGDCYIFDRDGKITELRTIASGLYSFKGTYSVSGSQVTIKWDLGSEETATVENIDGSQIKFTVQPKALSLDLPRVYTFTRVSDHGTFSLVSFNNPNSSPINYSTRWAMIDGTWTDWKSWTVKANSAAQVWVVGGFYCQVSFNSSFVDASAGKRYYLPFTVANSMEDPRIDKAGKYQFTTTLIGDIDLLPDKR